MKTAQDNLRMMQTNPPSPKTYNLPAGAKYQAAVQQDIADAKGFLGETRQNSALVSATQHPFGALGLALGLTCSMLGAFLIIVGASGHVAGEWTGLTAKELFVADGKRARFVLAKMLSTFLLGVWLLFCSWVGLALWGPISRHLFPIDSSATATQVHQWVVPQIWACVLVLILFAAVAAILGILTRHPIATLLIGVVVIFLVNYATRFDSVARYSPAAWVASLMGFHRKLLLIDHVWSESPQHLPEAWAIAGVCALCLVLVVAVIMTVRRRDALA